jgi:phosphoribosyl 1,2-cyclic phosphodiesterase
MGLPLFGPAYVRGNRICINGCHAELEAAFRRQHGAPSLPAEFDAVGASLVFVTRQPGQTYDIGGMQVTPIRQLHAGGSCGCRFGHAERSVVYSPDAEHKVDDPAATERFVGFFRDADVVVVDAMYSLADAVSSNGDWGHSSNVVGVELCQMAGARQPVLLHHEPVFDDGRIASIEAATRRFEEITREGHAPPAILSADARIVIDLARR